MSRNNPELKKFGLFPTALIFGAASIMMILGTHLLIPYLLQITGIETVIWWFLVAGTGIFIPLIITAIILLKREGYKISHENWKNRLRFRKMNSGDWIWGTMGIVSIGIISFVIMELINVFSGPMDHQPSFMKLEPLGPGRYWILAIWLPYWVLNIVGEEILWRGVILPGQEITFGRYSWILNAVGWGLFHIAFGWQLLLTLLPILFILPYIVQKRKNSWIGVYIHAAMNGPGFIAISFGLL